MSTEKRHLLEKLQVQIAAAAALVVGYFLLWPAVRPWQLHGTMAFLPMGQEGFLRLAIFAVVVWCIAAGCAMITLSSRPEGTLLATLAGTAAFSLRSGPMRMLLWEWPDNQLPKLFALLAVEALIMAAILLGAVIVIRIVRSLGGRLVPRLLWSATAGSDAGGKGTVRSEQARKNSPAMHVAGAVLMELAVATVLLMVTFRSTDRGQIAFALAGSFLLASLAAHQTFPIRASAALWFGPILACVLVFSLGSTGIGGGRMPVWYAARMVAQGLPLRAALPIDWLTFGGAGAAAGFWLSSRIHETQAIPRAGAVKGRAR